MKVYADSPGRRTAQIVGDVFLLCFVAVCVWAGRAVANGIGALRGPADSLQSAGSSFQQNMTGAAGQVGGVPIIGDTLRTPFESLSGTGQQLAQVGASMGSTVDTIARVAGVSVAAVPIVTALCIWLLVRGLFIRRATAASRMVRAPGSMELFALRALTRQPLRRLAPLGPNLAGRFRDGDPVLVRQLALLEMKSCGVSPEREERRPTRPAVSRPA